MRLICLILFPSGRGIQMLHWLLHICSSTKIVGIREAHVIKGKEFQFISPDNTWILFESLISKGCKVKDQDQYIRPSDEGNAILKGDGSRLSISCKNEEDLLFWVVPKSLCPNYINFMDSNLQVSKHKDIIACVFPQISNISRLSFNYKTEFNSNNVTLYNGEGQVFNSFTKKGISNYEINNEFFIRANVVKDNVLTLQVNFNKTTAYIDKASNTKKAKGTKYLAIGGVSSIAILLVFSIANIWSQKDAPKSKAEV